MIVGLISSAVPVHTSGVGVGSSVPPLGNCSSPGIQSRRASYGVEMKVRRAISIQRREIKGLMRSMRSRHWACSGTQLSCSRRRRRRKKRMSEVGCYHLGFGGRGVGYLGLSCWPPCLPYGCGYLRRISILKPPFVLGTEKGIVRPEKDLDKILTVSIQDCV